MSKVKSMAVEYKEIRESELPEADDLKRVYFSPKATGPLNFFERLHLKMIMKRLKKALKKGETSIEINFGPSDRLWKTLESKGYDLDTSYAGGNTYYHIGVKSESEGE